MSHFPGHQQALIKNNLCVAVLTFPEHEEIENNKVFEKFEYDTIVDLCSFPEDKKPVPGIGAAWNGSDFNHKIFDSWHLGEDLNWHSPIPEPEPKGSHYWDEEAQGWFELPPAPQGNQGEINE